MDEPTFSSEDKDGNDRLIQKCESFMNQLGVELLPTLRHFHDALYEYQKEWPGHRDIYPDDLVDLLTLIQFFERIKDRNSPIRNRKSPK